MTGQNYGFAAGADGETEDRGIFDDRPVDADPHGILARSADRVSAAFDADGVLDRRFWLPEIRDGMTFPAPQAIGFHFLDYVVHGWDVARSIGVPAEFDPELIEQAFAIAKQVPAGARPGRGGGQVQAGGQGPLSAAAAWKLPARHPPPPPLPPPGAPPPPPHTPPL